MKSIFFGRNEHDSDIEERFHKKKIKSEDDVELVGMKTNKIKGL